MRGREHRRRLARPLPYAAIVALSLLLTIPAIVAEPRLQDSFWIDWVWLDQFAAELGRGVLYPRWLPLSHGGLGSPVFYYYPPLSFYLAALFAVVGLSTYASLLAAFWAGFLLSGLAMYRWLDGWTRLPLVGALFYMAAPYHLLNFHSRGALAEFVGTALIPLLAIGIRRMADGRFASAPLTALAYGALIATHLPLALLVSLFFVLPYALFLCRKDPGRLAGMAATLALGAALSAIYLVPALLLQSERDATALWQHPTLQPANWSLWSVQSPRPALLTPILVLCASLAVPAAVLLLWQRSRWAAYALLCIAVGAGLLPALWTLPLLQSVQFPFRLLPIAEFALATAVALAPWRPIALAAALLPPLFVSMTVATAAPQAELSLEELREAHPDVPENLPPGERPYSWPSRWALDLASANRQPRWRSGVTVEPVFYFPAWQVRCDGRIVPTFPEPGTALLSYRGRDCVRNLGMTRAEILGAAVSGVALVALLLMLLLSLRRRRPEDRSLQS